MSDGYPTDQKCEQCGKVKNNFIEPRFGYISCQDCKDILPINRTGHLKKG